ncbi:MAG: hypothetical protein AMXMBFR12_00730 [Candidatus Babeliales bacterium]
MKNIGVILFCGGILMTFAINATELKKALHSSKHPFDYELGIRIIPGTKQKAPTTICCHGYGYSNAIIDVVHSFGVIQNHLVSFNFPDYECVAKKYDPKKSNFGSIDEVLPLLYVIKKCVIDANIDVINLYGFSAGGGAVINTLAVLNQNLYDEQLKKIGIDTDAKKNIISAIEKGLIILDCPLKSIDEIMEMRGKDPEFEILSQRYIKNNMRPIDSIEKTAGLNLTILLHFQMPDEILGNRDDKLFADRLTVANKGKTYVIFGNDGGHNRFHTSLWKKYKTILSSK